MRIDGKATRWAETQRVNREIDRIWQNPHAILVESPSVFAELTVGPECVEILNGGETWHVHDRSGRTPVLLEDVAVDEDGEAVSRRVTDIADHDLFEVAVELSPLDRIDWYEHRKRLIVDGLKCAAAISWDNGHEEQALEFRVIYQEIEGG